MLKIILLLTSLSFGFGFMNAGSGCCGPTSQNSQ